MTVFAFCIFVACTGAFLLDFWPERSGGWALYIGLAVLCGGVVVAVELAADRILGPDKVTDPLWQRVARLTMSLLSYTVFVMLLWLIARAM